MTSRKNQSPSLRRLRRFFGVRTMRSNGNGGSIARLIRTD